MQNSKINRREFIKGVGGAVAGAMAIPYIVPSSVFGADGAVTPSNRIVMGCIGVGAAGHEHYERFYAYP